MVPSYQMTFDDAEYQAIADSQPGRTAYIDECGSFGFDFTTEGASKYYILCAVIVEDHYLPQLHAEVEEIKKSNGFAKTEMKSCKISDDINRRSRIISQILPLDFRIVLMIADKQEFVRGTSITEHKKTFIKYMHQRLYELLYHVYPKLKIIEDEVGTTEFQESFKQYVRDHRPQYNILNEYDFDYCNSKDEILVQLADIIGGSINRALIDDTCPNYLEMLKSKVLIEDRFPNPREPYFGTVSPEDRVDPDIYALGVKCARDYIEKYKEDESLEKRAQIAFLWHLLFEAQNVSPFRYVPSDRLLNVLREYTQEKITKNFLYRKVVAHLRDAGVIIASSVNGYKIPASVDDITMYLNQTHAIVSPMLSRMGVCRRLIQQQTGNSLDILDDPAFLRYKKYFD